MTHRVTMPLTIDHLARIDQAVTAAGIDPAVDPVGRTFLALAQPEIRTPWMVTVTFLVSATGSVPTGLEISSPTGEAVTATLWRSVRPAELIDRARRTAWWLSDTAVPQETAEAITEPEERKGRGGRPALPDEHYRRVAAVYLAAAAAGEGREDAIKAEFELTKTDTAHKYWIREARRRGYLQ